MSMSASVESSVGCPRYGYLKIEEALGVTSIITEAVILQEDEQTLHLAVPAHAGITGNGPFAVEAIDSNGLPIDGLMLQVVYAEVPLSMVEDLGPLSNRTMWN